MRAGHRITPRAAGDAAAYRDRHQIMISGVKDDLVHPMAVAVMGTQLGWVAVGVLAPGLRAGGTGEASEGGQFIGGPARAMPVHRLRKSRVRVEHVVAGKRRDLVEDLMSRWDVDIRHSDLPGRTRPTERTWLQHRRIDGRCLPSSAAVTAANCGGGTGPGGTPRHASEQNASPWPARH